MGTICPVNLAQPQKWLVLEADATFPFSCPGSPSLSLSFHRKLFFFKGRWWRNYSHPSREPHTAVNSVVTPRYICTGSRSSADKQKLHRLLLSTLTMFASSTLCTLAISGSWQVRKKALSSRQFWCVQGASSHKEVFFYRLLKSPEKLNISGLFLSSPRNCYMIL